MLLVLPLDDAFASMQELSMKQRVCHFMPAGCLADGKGDPLLAAADVMMGAAAGPAMP